MSDYCKIANMFLFDVRCCKKENSIIISYFLLIWLLRYLDALLRVGAAQNANVATLFVGVTYQGKGTRSSLGKRGLGRSFKK
jgi:hypothetical protein